MTESLAWTCPKCSAWCWNHHSNCAACGQQKPAPAPPETPSDETRPEPPWRVTISAADWNSAKSTEELLRAGRNALVLWELRRLLNKFLADRRPPP